MSSNAMCFEISFFLMHEWSPPQMRLFLFAVAVVEPYFFVLNLLQLTNPSIQSIRCAIENENISFAEPTSFAAAIGFARFIFCFSSFVAVVVVVTARESVCAVCRSTQTQFEHSCHNHKLINVTRLFIPFISGSFFAPSDFMCSSENSGAKKEKKEKYYSQ